MFLKKIAEGFLEALEARAAATPSDRDDRLVAILREWLEEEGIVDPEPQPVPQDGGGGGPG